MRPSAAPLVLALLFASAASADPVAPGFDVTRVAGGGALSYVTGLAFDADGVLHVSEADLFTGSGRILRLEDRDGDGVTETVIVHADGLGIVTGIAFRGNGFAQGRGRGQQGSPMTPLERIRRGQFRGQSLPLVASHFVPGVPGSGTISILRDRSGDGVADSRQDIVTGLPSDGQNGNQQPAIGPDGLIYFGQGARTNAGGPADAPENGTILRVRADGSGLEVWARGLRNAFDLAFTADGALLATENGPDPGGPGPVAGAPDELNAIVPGEHHGWPAHHGFPPEGTGTVGPIATFSPSTSSDGLAISTSPTFCGYEDDVFVAQFGSFTNPAIGRRVVHVDFRGPRAMLVDELATGFGRPLDVAVGPDGNLYVADFSDEFFSPSAASIWRLSPADTDTDGIPDICAP